MTSMAMMTMMVIFLMVLQYIIVLFRNFGKEWPNGWPEVEPNFPPKRFPTELDLTAQKFRQKGREWWATLKIHLEQKWADFSSIKGFLQKSWCHGLDKSVLYGSEGFASHPLTSLVTNDGRNA